MQHEAKAAMSSKVELFVRAKNLADLDTFSKSDPMCVLFMRSQHTQGRWKKIGQTEERENDLNPVWSKKFVLDYYFEEHQELKFLVVDVDHGNHADHNSHDFLGQTCVSLGEIVSSRGGTYGCKLKDQSGRRDVKGAKKNSPSCLFVHFEQLSGGSCPNDFVNFTLACSQLPKMDFFGKSDPYVEIYRQKADSKEWAFVKTTETHMKTLNPTFEPMQFSMPELCRGNPQTKLLLVVQDYNKNGKPDYIGQCTTSIAELNQKFARPSTAFVAFTLKKPGKDKHRGNLFFRHYRYEARATFLDFIRGGLQIQLMIAVDFTGSNGNPASRQSLHYQGNTGGSQYEKAIRAIGNVLSPYDHDGLHPAWAFGCSYNPNLRRGLPGVARTYHCLPLSLDEGQIELPGVEGVVSAYKNMFHHVGLSGPTYFAEIINTCIGISQSTPFNSDAQAYNVLLILTDGVVSDLRNTVSALVTASGLPLSVIIVGVGNASFEAMEVLDGDDEKLRDHQGRTCKRDIVQFVPFNKFHGNAAQLAAHTLDELPGQVCDYALMKRVVPLQPMEVEEMTFELTRGATMMPDGKRGGYNPQQAPPPPPPAHAAPSPWTSHVDASSGKTYYYNASTGVTQWEAPPGFGNTAPPPPVPSMNALGQQGLAIFQQVINPSEPPPAFI